MKRQAFILVWMSLLSTPLTLSARSSNLLFHQGIILDSDGNPINGSLNVTFRIYPSDSSDSTETPTWEEARSVIFDNGVYNVPLGEIVPFPSGLFESDDLFLGLQIEDDREMTPRSQLFSVPWAQQSEVALTALSLVDNVVTSSKIAPASILATHLSEGAVGSREIASTNVQPGTYTLATVTVDQDGRITSAVNGTLPSFSLAPGGVTNIELADGAVTASKISGGAVGLNSLAPNSVESSKIIDGSIQGPDLAPDLSLTGTITVAGLNVTDLGIILDSDNAAAGANQSISFNRGTDNANDASLLWDEASNLFQFLADGTNLSRIQAGTPVDAGDLTTKAYVDSAVISGGSNINASNITSGTLDNARLAASVTLLGQTIETGEITSLDAAKLSGTIDNSRLSSSVSLLGQAIESGEIANLDSAKLTGSIDDTRLSTNVSLLGPSIETDEITDGTITSDDIADGTITATDISPTAAIADDQVNNNLTLSAGTIDNTPIGATTANTGAFSNLTASSLIVTPPSVETIAATATITANSCGTIKRISSAGAVTTDTTDTFTTPGAANSGCCMDVINTGSNNITLDENANCLTTAGGGGITLTANDAVRFCSDGTKWRQISSVSNL